MDDLLGDENESEELMGDSCTGSAYFLLHDTGELSSSLEAKAT